MITEISFFYRAKDESRPEHVVQDNPISDDTLLTIPNVGDTVSYMFGGDIVFRKVESRHVMYADTTGSKCIWLITVTDVEDEEMLKRLSKY